MILDHEWVGAAHANIRVLLLHGILGNRRNLRGFAGRLVAEFPNWRICLADLRHHGESHGFVPPNTIDSCAQDLLALAMSERVDFPIVMGHSFGGKVALALSEIMPIRQVWALDTPPGPIKTTFVQQVIATLKKIDLPITSRSDLTRQLEDLGLAHLIALWMTTNLREGKSGLEWAFDLPGVEELLQSHCTRSFAAMLRMAHPYTVYHFVRAAQGLGFLIDLSPGVYLHELPHSGHWVHIDNPEGLIEIIRTVLSNSPDLAADNH